MIIVPDIFLLESSLWPSIRAAKIPQVRYLLHFGAHTLCICTVPSLTTPWILLTFCASVYRKSVVCVLFKVALAVVLWCRWLRVVGNWFKPTICSHYKDAMNSVLCSRNIESLCFFS